MERKFNTEMRCQQEWGWLLSIWLFLSGTACGLFLLYELYDLPAIFGLLSVALLIAGGAVLLLEQGSPMRAWRAVSRVRTSWLSRGVIFVMLFAVFGVLALAPAMLPVPAWPAGLARLLHAIAAACALMIVLYPGFFLANNRSVPFWHTPLLPVLLLASSAMGAFALLVAGSSYLPQGLQRFGVLAAWTILANLALVLVHLVVMARAGGAAGKSVQLLGSGSLSWMFWGGVIIVGMAVPLALLLWIASPPVLAGACMLIGCFAFRYCLLRAGVYIPAAIAQQGLNFSRLNRTDAELEREYAAAAASTLGNRG